MPVNGGRDTVTSKNISIVGFFAAQAISSAGNRIGAVALPFSVLSAGGTIEEVGWLYAAVGVVTLVFTPVGGTLGDRFPRLSIMEMANYWSFAMQLLTAIECFSATTDLAAILVLQIAAAAGTALFGPAFSSVLPELTDDLISANARLVMQSAVIRVVAPVLGGLLVTVFNVGTAFCVDAASFLISSLLLGAVAASRRSYSSTKTPVPAAVKDNIRFDLASLLNERWLLLLFLSTGLWTVFSLTPTLLLGVELSVEELGGVAGWSLIISCYGAGSVLGGLAAQRWGERMPVYWCVFGIVLFCPLPFSLALQDVLVVVLSAAIIAGAGESLGTVLQRTAIQRRIDPRLLSRAVSVNSMCVYAASPLGYALVGYLSAIVDARPLLVMAGAIAFGCVGFAFDRSLRDRGS